MSQNFVRRIASRMDHWIYTFKTYCQPDALLSQRAFIVLAAIMLMTMPLTSFDAQASSAAEAAATAGVEEGAEPKQTVFPKETFEESVTEMMLTHRMIEHEAQRAKVVAKFPHEATRLADYVKTLQVLDESLYKLFLVGRYVDDAETPEAPTFLELWQGCSKISEACPDWVDPQLWRAYVASRLYDMATGELPLPEIEGDNRGKLGHRRILQFPPTLNHAQLRTKWHTHSGNALQVTVQSLSGTTEAVFPIPNLAIPNVQEVAGPLMRMVYVAAMMRNQGALYAVSAFDDLTSQIITGVAKRVADAPDHRKAQAGKFEPDEMQQLSALHTLRYIVFSDLPHDHPGVWVNTMQNWIASRHALLDVYGMQDVDGPVDGAQFAYDTLHGGLSPVLVYDGLCLAPVDVSVVEHDAIVDVLNALHARLVGLVSSSYEFLSGRTHAPFSGASDDCEDDSADGGPQEGGAAAAAAASGHDAVDDEDGEEESAEPARKKVDFAAAFAANATPDFSTWLSGETQQEDYGRMLSWLAQASKMTMKLMANMNLPDDLDAPTRLSSMQKRLTMMKTLDVNVYAHPGLLASMGSDEYSGHVRHLYYESLRQIMEASTQFAVPIVQLPFMRTDRFEADAETPEPADMITRLVTKLEVMGHVLGTFIPGQQLAAEHLHGIAIKEKSLLQESHKAKNIEAMRTRGELDQTQLKSEMDQMTLIVMQHESEVRGCENLLRAYTPRYAAFATHLGEMLAAPAPTDADDDTDGESAAASVSAAASASADATTLDAALLAKAVAAHAQAMKNLS